MPTVISTQEKRLICLQTAFGRACDHPKISSYLKYHQEESRVLQAPDGDSTNCASPRCHSPMSPPDSSPACPQNKFWAVVAYLNLLHYSNYSNYLNCSSWVRVIEASKKLVFILRAADTEVCAVFPVLLPQQPPANLGGCTSTRPVPLDGSLPLDASLCFLCQQAAQRQRGRMVVSDSN